MKKNQVWKKIVSGVLVTGLVAGIFTGCGSSGSSTDNNTADTDASAGAAAASEEAGSDSGEVTTIYATTSGSVKPYTFYDDDNNLVGYDVEVLEAVFDKLPQYELEWVISDFSSLFANLDSDRVQIAANDFVKNEERKEKYLFSYPTFHNTYLALFPKGSEKATDVNSWDDLAGMTTINQTAIASTNAIERYNEANPDNPINLEYTEEEIILQLQELQAGKCDFVVIEKPVYEFYKQEYNLDLEERELSDDVLSDIFADPYAFFLINSAHPDLVEAIDGALEEVMSDGTVTAISEKYFGVDFAPDYSSLNLEDYK